MRGPDGGYLTTVYAVAERLGLTVTAVLQMPAAEFSGWLAYFEEFPQRTGCG